MPYNQEKTTTISQNVESSWFSERVIFDPTLHGLELNSVTDMRGTQPRVLGLSLVNEKTTRVS